MKTATFNLLGVFNSQAPDVLELGSPSTFVPDLAKRARRSLKDPNYWESWFFFLQHFKSQGLFRPWVIFEWLTLESSRTPIFQKKHIWNQWNLRFFILIWTSLLSFIFRHSFEIYIKPSANFYHLEKHLFWNVLKFILDEIIIKMNETFIFCTITSSEQHL